MIDADFKEMVRRKKEYDGFLARMEEAVEEDDYEKAHEMADKILCDFVKSLGHTRLVKLFNKVSKQYA